MSPGGGELSGLVTVTDGPSAERMTGQPRPLTLRRPSPKGNGTALRTQPREDFDQCR